jgi:hypothetical protein
LASPLLEKCPPDKGRDTKHTEKVRGDVHSIDWIGAVARAQIQADTAEIIGCHGLKCAALSPCHEFRDGNRRSVAVRELTLDAHDPLRIRERQRCQQNPVNHGKDCRVRADAERNGQDRDDGEARTLDQNARGMADVCQ